MSKTASIHGFYTVKVRICVVGRESGEIVVVTGRPRARSAEQVRAVALELFREHGYAGTSLSLIAARSGISRTTLFSYFPAKHDLVWGESAQTLQRMREALAQRPSDENLAVSVSAVLAAQVGFAEADRAAVRERWRVVDSDPELRRMAVQCGATGQILRSRPIR